MRTRFPHLLAVSLLAAASLVACSGADEGPSFTTGVGGGGAAGTVGAGQGGSGIGGTGVAGTGGQGGESVGGGGQGGVGGGQGGSDPCVACSEVVQSGSDPADLCADNGPPSSSTIYDELFQCVCVVGCAVECDATACQGLAPDQGCESCAGDVCGDQVQACTADLPPPCTTCSDAIDGFDPTNLCDANGPPPSQEIFSELFACACVDSCDVECDAACGGGEATNTCQQCVFQNCEPEVTACLADA